MEDSKTDQDKREQTFIEKIHDLGTNFLFNVSGWSFKSSLPFKKDDYVVIQGKNINKDKNNYEKNCKEALEQFYNIIWITYRKNFPPLLYQIVDYKNQKMSEYISDTGWGCMVRVGQMAFAEALRRHLVEHKKLIVKKKEDLRGIIEGFIDDDEQSADIAPYSIQKISKRAYAEFKLLPGEWYTPIRICYILGLLHNEIKCLPGTEDLKVAVFTSSRPIVFQDFLERMCLVDHKRGKHAQICDISCRIIEDDQQNNYQNMNKCHGQHKQLEKQSSNSDVIVVTEEKPQLRLVCPVHHQLQYSMVVYIVCLIGLEKPQPEYLELTKKMMDFKYSMGLIGGKPKKALYFLGRVGDDLIYLDPHYVQESTNKKNFQSSSQFESYFCKKFQTYSSENIDSSFSLMFYLKDLEQLEEFYQFMMKLKREYNEHFFMMMEDTEPSYSYGDGKESSNLISVKNLEQKQQKEMQKQNQQNNQHFEVFEDVDGDGSCKNSKNQNKNGQNQKDQKDNNDDEDEYEVI